MCLLKGVYYYYLQYISQILLFVIINYPNIWIRVLSLTVGATNCKYLYNNIHKQIRKQMNKKKSRYNFSCKWIFIYFCVLKKQNKKENINNWAGKKKQSSRFHSPCLRLHPVQAYRIKVLNCIQTLKWEVKNKVKCLYCLFICLLVSHFGYLTSSITAMELKT